MFSCIYVYKLGSKSVIKKIIIIKYGHVKSRTNSRILHQEEYSVYLYVLNDFKAQLYGLHS